MRVFKETGTEERREVNWLRTGEQDRRVKELFMLGTKGAEREQDGAWNVGRGLERETGHGILDGAGSTQLAA